MKKTESEILTEVYGRVRDLSNIYISALKDTDTHKQLEINGVKFNSAHWIVAHLAWTEHFLFVKGIGGENMKIDWLDEYSFGSKPEEIKSKPAFEKIIKNLDEIHQKAIEIIKNLTDEELSEENHINATFGSSKSKRNVILHAIRHEPMHVGQLSWILKTNGI